MQARVRLPGMKRWLGISVGFLILAGTPPVPAAQTDYLFRNERVCDEAGEFCMTGTFSYEPNPRLLFLRARVQSAPGPGLLRIRLIGTTRLGHSRFAPFEVRVRGDFSEIINHKMIPDYPEALEWAVQRIEFVADQARTSLTRQ